MAPRKQQTTTITTNNNINKRRRSSRARLIDDGKESSPSSPPTKQQRRSQKGTTAPLTSNKTTTSRISVKAATKSSSSPSPLTKRQRQSKNEMETPLPSNKTTTGRCRPTTTTTSTISSLQTTIDKMQQELDGWQEKYNTMGKDHETTQQGLQQKIDSLKNECNQQKVTIQHLNESLAAHKKNNGDLQHDIKSKTERIYALEKTILRLQEEKQNKDTSSSEPGRGATASGAASAATATAAVPPPPQGGVKGMMDSTQYQAWYKTMQSRWLMQHHQLRGFQGGGGPPRGGVVPPPANNSNSMPPKPIPPPAAAAAASLAVAAARVPPPTAANTNPSSTELSASSSSSKPAASPNLPQKDDDDSQKNNKSSSCPRCEKYKGSHLLVCKGKQTVSECQHFEENGSPKDAPKQADRVGPNSSLHSGGSSTKNSKTHTSTAVLAPSADPNSRVAVQPPGHPPPLWPRPNYCMQPMPPVGYVHPYYNMAAHAHYNMQAAAAAADRAKMLGATMQQHMQQRDPSSTRGRRGKDAGPRKDRTCRRCRENGGTRMKTCPGRARGAFCQFFDEDGKPRVPKNNKF